MDRPRDTDGLDIMPTILLTGFAPFGDSKSNPSQQIVERLHGETIGGAQVVGLTLPVVMSRDWDILRGAIDTHQPVLVLSLGLASGTPCLDVERFAVNLQIAEADDPAKPLPPNPTQSVIVPGGPPALFPSLDAEAMAAACREAGTPARAHGYAGSYACNHILYQVLHYAAEQKLPYRAGFIHLPLSSEQVISENKLHLPSLPLSLMMAGVRAAVAEAMT